MSEINTFERHDLICPFCGARQNRADLEDFEDDYECHNCHEIFEYERVLVPIYTSRKVTN